MHKLLTASLLALRLIVVGIAGASALMPFAPAQATLNTTANKTIALGTGAATQFSFSFVGVSASYVSVIFTDAGGTQTVLTQGAGVAQYQIVLNPPVQGAIWGVGGTVTYNPSGVPIANGTTLTIFRTLPLTQAITLQNQSSIATLGKGAETGLDTTTMEIQQLNEAISRSIEVPIVDAVAPAPLPALSQRRNQGACFDNSGNLVNCASVSPTTIIAGNGILFSGINPLTISVIGDQTNPQIGNYTLAPSDCGKTVQISGRVLYVHAAGDDTGFPGRLPAHRTK